MREFCHGYQKNMIASMRLGRFMERVHLEYIYNQSQNGKRYVINNRCSENASLEPFFVYYCTALSHF